MIKLKVGMEVHAQLLTKSKLFCDCPVVYDAPPNTCICPICMGHPGTLPNLNKKAVELAIKAALALNCEIQPISIFARKNYFYPDLPKGYQITQYDKPLAINGYLDIRGKRIRIRRVHLEEESGKLIHMGNRTLVDFNRCGIPLIEIVTEPDIESPEEAQEYLIKLRQILRYIKVCGGDMEKGQLRCEPNLSVEVNGKTSPKFEIKNLNSIKAVARALEYEKNRIAHKLLRGERLYQTTLGWDDIKGVTFEMREKETSADYRYFPEPDIPPLVIDHEWVEEIKNSMEELPDAKLNRFINQYGLCEYDAKILIRTSEYANYFEALAKHVKNLKLLKEFMIGDLLALLDENKLNLSDLPFSQEEFAKLINYIHEGKITRNMGKIFLRRMVEEKKKLKELIKGEASLVVEDKELIEKLLKEILKEHPKEVEKYKSGKKGVFGYFMGELMRKTRGQCNPKIAKEILEKLLEE